MISTEQARRNAAFFAARSTAPDRADRPISLAAIGMTHTLPSVSDIPSFAPLRIDLISDRMCVQEITHGTPGHRAGVRLVVHPGAKPQAREPQTPREQGSEEQPARTPGERRQQWMDKEAAAGRQRRQ